MTSPILKGFGCFAIIILNDFCNGRRDYSSSRISLRHAGQFLNARNGVGHQANLVEDIIPDVLFCAIIFENCYITGPEFFSLRGTKTRRKKLNQCFSVSLSFGALADFRIVSISGLFLAASVFSPWTQAAKT